ncbi:MAG: serine hydrolase domain-containing protein [Actinomycetes bacterium]
MAEIDLEALRATQPLIEEIAAQVAREFTLDSVVWGLVAGDQLLTSGTTGTISNVSTRYRIASMTKSFTAAAVLSLRDEGLLSIDIPVEEYAPELAAICRTDSGTPITLRHLLSMTSGLATDDPWADRHLDATAQEMNDLYQQGAAYAFAPGTYFEYSNLGFALIGRVVERVTGRRVRDFVDERFLESLHMTSTTWDPPFQHEWAPPTRVQDGQIIPDGLMPLGDGEISPMGGLWTTVADLSRWVIWLNEANNNVDSKSGQLSVASRRDMQIMHIYAGVIALDGEKAPSGYGYGLMMRDDPTLGIVNSHSGGLPGYGSNMRWLSGRDIGVVAMSNTTYAPMAIFTHRVLKMLHSANLVPETRTAISEVLQQRSEQLVVLLNDWDSQQAQLIFADNVALDESLERRQAAALKVVTEHGPLVIKSITPSSHIEAVVECVNGKKIDILLGPLRSATIQWYELK